MNYERGNTIPIADTLQEETKAPKNLESLRTNPNWRQKFLASEIPTALLFVCVQIFLNAAILYLYFPSTEELLTEEFEALAFEFLFFGFLLGCALFLMALPIVLAPFNREQCRLNGDPFQVGDYVQIIKGPWTGEIVPVIQLRQFGQPRVDLGPDAARDCSDIFSPLDVILVWRKPSLSDPEDGTKKPIQPVPEGNASPSLSS